MIYKCIEELIFSLNQLFKHKPDFQNTIKSFK